VSAPARALIPLLTSLSNPDKLADCSPAKWPVFAPPLTFVDAVVDLVIGCHEEQWIMSKRNDNWTRFALLEVFFPDVSSVLSR
jgi:hypothetical protein